MHKFAFGKQPESLNDMFIPLGSNNRNGNYCIQKYKLNFLTNSHLHFCQKYGMIIVLKLKTVALYNL